MKKLMFSGYKVILKNLACILLILALIPSVNYHLFNGFPLSSLAEYALLISLLPFVFLRKFSRLHTMRLGRLWRRLPLAFVLLAVLATAAKAALFQSGTYEGFKGCYASPSAPPAAGSCERSYENPFFRFGATRLDRSLWFDQSNWDLGFVNSTRFQFYTLPGMVDRMRLPLTVGWTGNVAVGQNEQVVVTYVGEGQIKIGETETILPAVYGKAGEVTLMVPQGIHPVDIHYAFDDGYRSGDPTPGEYAVFRLWQTTESGERLPLTALPSPVFWRFLGGFVDLVTAALWASILYAYLIILRRKLIVLLVVVLAGWGSLVAPKLPGLDPSRLLLILLGALFVYFLLQRRAKHSLLLAYLCLACLGLIRVLMDGHGLMTVIVQVAGSDFLTYESFAREILETGSLRAGEDIFYYQPAYRYLAFILHLLLGEGSVLVSALAVTALNWGILFVSDRLIRHAESWLRRLITLGTISIVLILVNAGMVVNELVITQGASEYPTWIILSVALGFILSPKPSKFWFITTLLIGLGMIIRTEQIPALAVVYLIFLIRTYRAGRKVLMPSLGLLLGIFLLPALHNLYYGSAFAILPVSKGIPESLAISPIKALTTLASRDTQQIIIQQIKNMAGFGSRFTVSMGLALPLHILQALWLFAWLYALIRWRSTGWVSKLVLLLPFAYLGVYLFYYSHYDYPRHVLAGYLAMGYGVLLLASGFGRREAAR